jgi:hypothetical protein
MILSNQSVVLASSAVKPGKARMKGGKAPSDDARVARGELTGAF